MTDLLTRTLTERAEAVATPHLDVGRIVSDGNRRVARRRLAIAGGGAAAAVAVGAVAASVLPVRGGGVGRETASEFADAFAAGEPSYAVGSSIHVDGRSFDVGRPVVAYVQTEVGVVFADEDGRIWASDGATADQVGSVAEANPDYPHLEADGTTVAWVEGERGGVPQFAVLDQSTGEVVRDPLGNVAGMGTTRDGRDPAAVFAVDQGIVYVRDHRGAVRWDPRTGAQRVLSTEADGFTITDVEGGVIVSRAGEGWFRVGRELGSREDCAPPACRLVRAWNADDLSPDGRYVIAEQESDVPRAVEVNTSEEVALDPGEYDYFGPYAWLADDRYAALGVSEPFESTPVDVLVCDLAGTCEPDATAVGSLGDGFTLPVGVSLAD